MDKFHLYDADGNGVIDPGTVYTLDMLWLIVHDVFHSGLPHLRLRFVVSGFVS